MQEGRGERLKGGPRSGICQRTGVPRLQENGARVVGVLLWPRYPCTTRFLKKCTPGSKLVDSLEQYQMAQPVQAQAAYKLKHSSPVQAQALF